MPVASPPMLRHTGRYLRDRDVRRAAVVCLFAMLLSGGLVWTVYLLRTRRVAARAALAPQRARTVLVFGQQLLAGRPGPDYEARLQRALDLLRAGRAERLLLLGGCSGPGPSEARAGFDWLVARGLPASAPVVLEEVSVDSLENLRHARSLLALEAGGNALPPVALLTSRYHLARCLLLATRLGFDSEPVAAEADLAGNRGSLGRLLLEATYLMWIDLGLRWARLTGNRRMTARIS